MKTIGLLGGMSWESTALYYRLINGAVAEHLGGLHSAEILLYSIDFDRIERLQRSGRWDAAAELLADAAGRLEAAGADLLLLCTNTMHKVAPQIEARLSVPLLHIADATGDAIRAQGVHRVALLGTRFTMEEDFYRGRLEARHALEVLVPSPEDRETVHRIIYEELCRGRVLDPSRDAFRRIAGSLAMQGAEGIILGCTEIAMLLQDGDTELPLFDTTSIHACSAAAFALGVARV